MQWQQMDWPVLWDPFNLLEFSAVPVTYLLDSAGRVLVVQPLLDRIDDIHRRLSDQPAGVEIEQEADRLLSAAGTSATPSGDADSRTWSDYAVSLALWGKQDRLDEAVDAARSAVEQSDDPVLWFRLGVVLRMRFDSPQRQPRDFTEAVAAWSRALDADPNQYIWRRRLQQYGPRLAKPYPFYDWVPRARTDIESRGEHPVELVVEPHGAEFASPAGEMEPIGSDEPGDEPDPDARVHADRDGLIDVEAVLIPPAPRPGDTARVHLFLTPDRTREAHWNNEAGHDELWVDPPPDWLVGGRHQLLPVGTGDVSDETRHLEFEVAIPEAADSDRILKAYLLYYVCEGAAGVCVYLRQDLEISIPIKNDQQAIGLAG